MKKIFCSFFRLHFIILIAAIQFLILVPRFFSPAEATTAGTGITVALVSDKTSYLPDETATVNITINNPNGHKISAAELHISYGPGLTGQTITKGSYLQTTFSPLPTIGNGTASIVLGSSPDNPPTAPSGILATLTFKVHSTSQIQFDSNTAVAAINISTGIAYPGDVLEPNGMTSTTINTVNPTSTPTHTPIPTITPTLTLTPTVTSSPSITPTATPSVTPSPIPSPTIPTNPTPTRIPNPQASLSFFVNGPAFINEPFLVDVNFGTNSPVAGVDAVIHYDPNKLSADSIEDHRLLPITPKIVTDAGTGTIRFSQLAAIGQYFTGNGTMITIHFTPKQFGDTPVTYEFTPGGKTGSTAIDLYTGENILISPSNTTVSVLDHASLQIGLSVPYGNGSDVTGTVNSTTGNWTSNFTTDTQGNSNILSVTDTFINSVKTFVVKITGFLRERFTITVNPGVNQAAIGPLRAGDLNDDGTINNVDLSLMYDDWFASGKSDLNRDGVVNTSDYWILTQNFLKSDN